VILLTTLCMDNTEKVRRTKEIIQEWMDKQGQDRCWYYPDLFRELAELFDVDVSKNLALPPIEEFRRGCEKYQQEEYAK